MKKLAVVLLLVLSACLFCACGAAEPPAPAETPAPTPEPTPMPTSLTLSDESAEEILALAQIPTLRSIDATASREYEALAQLRELLPDCEISWVYELNGQLLPSDTEELVLTDPTGLEDALPYLPALKSVDLTACEPTVEQMELCYDLRPDVDFLWMVRFGEWEVRSDITCFSTLRTGMEGNHAYTSEELYPLLRFCRHLRALDLGHNDLQDISLIGELPELQALILADNPNLSDISPLANLKNLYYLEMFLGWSITDFTPLAGLENMEDINLSWCHSLTDISFVEHMPKLKHLWLLSSFVDNEQIKKYQEMYPDATIMKANPIELTSVAYGWRTTDRNIALRGAFTYWRNVIEFVSWDNIEFDEAFYNRYK